MDFFENLSDFYFDGIASRPKVVNNPFESLGNGFSLRPIELRNKKNEIIENKKKYSHLYKDDEKVCDSIFRKGGLGGKFKDGYCNLIHYTLETNPKLSDNGFSFGECVIINEKGDIILSRDGSSYPHHIGGHLGSLDNYIYDLRSCTVIAPLPSSGTICGKSCIILNHKYNFGYKKEIIDLPVGIYQIDFETAVVTKIDEIDK